MLLTAALLHDVGYAPQLHRTGFHPLDGASWLTGLVQRRVVALVAHHSCAWAEAWLRGVSEELAVVPVPDPELLQALTFCDMTSGPTGELVTVNAHRSRPLLRGQAAGGHLLAGTVVDAGGLAGSPSPGEP